MNTNLLVPPTAPFSQADLEILDAATRREFLVMLGAAGLLAACGNSGGDGSAESAETAERTVEDATGPISLPAQFERPVPTDGIYAANMLSLGIQPAALPSDVKLQLSTVSEYLPAGADLEALPEIGLQYEVNLEALASAEPDLIVAGEFDLEKYGDALRTIAPTYIVEHGTNGEWRKRFMRVAEALGREPDAAAVSDEFDAFVALLPIEVTQQTVAFVRAGDLGDIRADILETSFAGSVAREAAIPVLDLTGQVPVEADASFIELSEESLGLLADADVIVVADLSFYDPATEASDVVLANSPLWNNLPAVAAGKVVVVPGPVYNGGHYQAATALLTAMADTLAAG